MGIQRSLKSSKKNSQNSIRKMKWQFSDNKKMLRNRKNTEKIKRQRPNSPRARR